MGFLDRQGHRGGGFIDSAYVAITFVGSGPHISAATGPIVLNTTTGNIVSFRSANVEQVTMTSGGNISTNGTLISNAAASAIQAPNGHVYANSFRAIGDDGAVSANQTKFTATTGIGDGANTNIQAPAKGTGTGPASMVVFKFVKWWDGSTVGWMPLLPNA